MNNAKTLNRHEPLSFPKIAVTSVLFFGLLLLANLAIAQSSSRNGGQWRSVGGEMVASGEGNFSNKWSAATRYFHGDGKYWKNDEPTSNPTTGKKIPATHTLEEVTKDVWKRQGQITVRGPGFLGLFIRSKGAGAVLKSAQSGKVFITQGLGKDEWLHDAQNNWKWHPGEVVNIDPNQPLGGWVPAGKTITLDVWAYNPFSDWGVWGSGYSAPKSVEYEFWFFPRKGGKVIKVAEAPGKPAGDNIDDHTSASKPPCEGEYLEKLKKRVAKLEPGIYILCAEGDDIEIDRRGNGDYEDAEELLKKEGFIKLSKIGNVVTGKNSKAIIGFGKRGTVTVKDFTNFSIWEYMVSDEGITVNSNMKVGKIDVKLDRRYKEIDFTVSTPAVTNSVRGTEFTVSHKESPMKSTITVYSGKVEVTPKLCSEPARILTAGQRITVDDNCFGDLEVFEPKDTDKPATSGKITHTGTQPPQTGSGGAGSGTVSVGGPAQGTARLLTASSDRDLVGRNETFRGNGKKDAIFQAQFSAPNRTVTAVEVSNTNGLRSVWDTRPNNRLWLGGVVIGGRTMNRADGSVNFSLGSGQNTLDFFVEDNGSIRDGKTNYRMTIFFASGDPLIMDVAPGGGGAGSSNSKISGVIKIESATYGANCGVAKGNVTAHIAKQCDGKTKCRYVVNHKIIGDPAYGCAKTYTVRYRCGNNPRVFDRALSAEAGWGDKAVLLECPGSQD